MLIMALQNYKLKNTTLKHFKRLTLTLNDGDSVSVMPSFEHCSFCGNKAQF